MNRMFIFSALFFSSVAGWAQCSSKSVTIDEELRSSGETIVGTVEDAQPTPDSSFHMDGVNYIVRVDEVLHGRMLGTHEVRIFSENSPEKFPMQVGKQYLLFVHLDYNRYEVDRCGNSGLLETMNKENAALLRQYARKN